MFFLRLFLLRILDFLFFFRLGTFDFFFFFVGLPLFVAVKSVGIALVSSFGIIPAASARMLGRSLASIAAIGVGIGVSGAALGLLLSYHLNVASGATIILTLGSVFALSLALRRR